MNEGIKVVLAPEHIGTLWGLPITNTLITSWIVVGILVVTAVVMGKRLRMTPSRFQTLLEWVFSFVYDYVSEILGSRDLGRRFFPLIVTLFLFIFTANIIEFTPGIGKSFIVYSSSVVSTKRTREKCSVAGKRWFCGYLAPRRYYTAITIA